jgi:hypothetical protein
MKPLVVLVLLVALPSTASAQTEQPIVEVRTGFGASHYLHADLDYTAPTFLISARVGRGALAFEPEFALASHEDTQSFGLNTSTTSRWMFQSMGLNIIGRSGGDVSFYGGGGPGFYLERTTYRLNDPVFGYEQKNTRGPRLGAQGLAGVDVPVAPHVKVFGQFRYEVRSLEDPGGGSVVQGFGGVSIVLK